MDHEMSHAARRTAVLVLGLSLLTTALAGCLSEQPAEDARPSVTTHVSRSYTIAMTPEAAEAIEHAEDPEAVVRDLIQSSLVVRVILPGDYTLAYTDKNGVAQTKQIFALEPGKPQEVTDVDPLTALTLKDALGNVVYERKGVPFSGFHLAEVPLGFQIDSGAEAAYAFTSSVSEEFAVRALKIPTGGPEASIDELYFRLVIPLAGTLGWKAGSAGADGIPIAFTSTTGVAPGAQDLVLVDAKGVIDGAPHTGGMSLKSVAATATGTGTLWFRDGQPVAAQWNGALGTFDPTFTSWATGPLSESAEFACAGKTRADNCRFEEVYAQTNGVFPASSDLPAGPKDSWDLPTTLINDERDSKALDLLRRILAQDLEVDDSFTVIGAFDSTALGLLPSQGDFSGSMVSKMTVTEKGPVKVTAGTFQALKLVTTVTTKADVERLTDGSRPLVSGFDFNEEVSRSTLWLEQGTYLPLKLEATTPVNFDKLVDEMLNSIDQSVWGQAGVPALRADQLNVKVETNFGYEATRVAPGSRFSPVVGLLLGNVIGSAPYLAPAGIVGASAANALSSAFGAPMTPTPPPGYGEYDYGNDYGEYDYGGEYSYDDGSE